MALLMSWAMSRASVQCAQALLPHHGLLRLPQVIVRQSVRTVSVPSGIRRMLAYMDASPVATDSANL
jgi:hypothetical protein